MDTKIKTNTRVLTEVLESIVSRRNRNGETAYELIADDKHGHYQIIRTGWRKDVFDFSVIIHFQVKLTGKIWLLVNNTDLLITDTLIERGVAKSDIVIGFLPERMRTYSGYAVA